MLCDLFDQDFFIYKLLGGFVCSCEFKRIGYGRFALLHTGNHIRAPDPVGFSEIGCRPLSRMVGMRMVEADNIFAALAPFALDADQFAGIDVVAIMRRIAAGVAATGG